MDDSKEPHRKTWYFCNFPHCFCVKCHTHTTNTCRTCTHMLEYQGDYKPTTNTKDSPPNSKSSQSDTDISSISNATDSSDVTSLLAYALNIMVNYPEAKESVASALMDLNQTLHLYHRLIIVIFSILCLWFPILTYLLYLLYIYLGNPYLLTRLVLLPNHPREPIIRPCKPRERTPPYSTPYYHSTLFSVRIEDAVIDSSSMVL